MSTDILFPGEVVQPLEVGEGFGDFLLSDILAAKGIVLEHINLVRSNDAEKAGDMLVRIESVFLRDILIAPVLRDQVDIITPYLFDDLRLRFFDGSQKPVWVSAMINQYYYCLE